MDYGTSEHAAAVDLISRIETDSPELTTALNGLITAKDSAVRAGIRHDTGRAGSVPRPQAVVVPPLFGAACPICGEPAGEPHSALCAWQGREDPFKGNH